MGNITLDFQSSGMQLSFTMPLHKSNNHWVPIPSVACIISADNPAFWQFSQIINNSISQCSFCTTYLQPIGENVQGKCASDIVSLPQSSLIIHIYSTSKVNTNCSVWRVNSYTYSNDFENWSGLRSLGQYGTILREVMQSWYGDVSRDLITKHFSR